MRCPVCDNPAFRLWAPESAIRREIRFRNEFVRSRLTSEPAPAEVKDLLDFMHGSPAPLYECPGCGMVVRGEETVRSAASYEQDHNDRDLMKQLLPVYLEAFRRKAPYRDLLPRGARVLEVASHLGAFLQIAEEWNWNADALDIGLDTAAFARDQGFRVHREIIEHAPYPDRSFDAIFIWNCFEQLEDPRSALRAAHGLLRHDGLLVVRVPNLRFYRERRDRRALAYNNLLGFPYLYGYSPATLERLMTSCGFEPLVGFNSELITMPFADRSASVTREQESVSSVVERWSAGRQGLSGPWIEMVFRRTEQPAQNGPDIDRRFLRRAA